MVLTTYRLSPITKHAFKKIYCCYKRNLLCSVLTQESKLHAWMAHRPLTSRQERVSRTMY